MGPFRWGRSGEERNDDDDMMSRSLRGTAALLLAGAVTLTGCGSTAQTAQGDTVTAIQDRPSLGAVEAEFAVAEDRVKAAVSEILPGPQWRLAYESETSPCRENEGQDDSRALRVTGGRWELRAVPTEEQWARIREQVTPIVADFGFTEILMDTAVPDGNTYRLAGPFQGSSFMLAYRKAMVMGFTSGCHLPEE